MMDLDQHTYWTFDQTEKMHWFNNPLLDKVD